MNPIATPADLVLEYDAATWATQNKPQEYAGVSRKGTQEDVDWLANVAFWRAYPSYAGKKIEPGDAVAVQVWLRVREVVRSLLAAAQPLPWTKSAPVWPLASTPRTKIKAGSRFGVKRPWTGATKRHHCGNDVGVPLGTAVLAPEPGITIGCTNCPSSQTGWETPVKATVIQLDSGFTLLLGGIAAGTALPKGVRVKPGDKVGAVGAYPKGDTMLHVQLYQGLLTAAQVEQQKSWAWDGPQPPALLDPEPWLVTAAMRTQLGKTQFGQAFYGFGEDDQALLVEDVEQAEGLLQDMPQPDPPAPAQEFTGRWGVAAGLLGLGFVAFAVTRK